MRIQCSNREIIPLQKNKGVGERKCILFFLYFFSGKDMVLFVVKALNGSMPCVYIFIQLFFCWKSKLNFATSSLFFLSAFSKSYEKSLLGFSHRENLFERVKHHTTDRIRKPRENPFRLCEESLVISTHVSGEPVLTRLGSECCCGVTWRLADSSLPDLKQKKISLKKHLKIYILMKFNADPRGEPQRGAE